MEGPIKQLYEKDGNEFKPIRACGCDGSSGDGNTPGGGAGGGDTGGNTPGGGGNEGGNNGGGGGSLPSSISATASAYLSDIATAEASVNADTGLFKFRFGLPRGMQGEPGKDGKDGKDGDTPVAYKSVTVFKTYIPTVENPKPAKPVGGIWDVQADVIVYPEGWSSTDDLEKPIWMSVGEFTSIAPNNPKWSEPIMISGEDGNNGTDGVNVEFIYKLTKTDYVVPDKPESANQTEAIPDGWTDSPSGISEEMQCEWVCTRKKEDSGDWGAWSNPVIWSKWGVNGMDGDGVEYIYQVNNGEPLDNPTPDDTSTDEYQGKGQYEGKEYVPTHLGWTDNPTGVSLGNTHEWVCVRKQKNGLWQPFSNPALWAKYGEQGTNGISIRTMYAKTTDSKTPPPFVQDDINPGSIWGLVIPNYESPEAIWSISAYVTYDNKLATIELPEENGISITIYGWQGPILVSGVAGIDGRPINYKTYVYKLSDTKPNKPTGNDPHNPGDNWTDYPNTSGQWWQCIGDVDGVTELVTNWGEVLPVNGRDGVAQDGKYVEFRFALGNSYLTPPDLDINVRTPNGWDITPPVKQEGQYMWMTTSTINPDDSFSPWSTPICISGEKGPQGETGPTGPAGPAGPQGISGIPGRNIQARYCLGTQNVYTAKFNETISKDIDPSEHGWSGTIPPVTNQYPYIWCIQTSFVYVEKDGQYVEQLGNPWSNPFRLNGINGVDGKGVGISKVDEYYQVNDKSTGVTTNTGKWYLNEIPQFTDTNIYLWNYEVIHYDNGTTAPPTTPAIIGKQGKDGTDGRGIVSIVDKYLASSKNSGITISTSGWLSYVPNTTSDSPYLWNWERITYTDGTHDDFVAIIGSRGSDGATGRSGQIVYPAGVYYQDRTYTGTKEKAPYVLDTQDGNYYVMNYIGTWVPNEQNGYTPAQSYAKNGTKYWTLLEAFDAIYANVGVIANGLIGAAVFNGNYMFSQYGEGNYEDFPTGTSNPYNEANGFKPAWCVNLLTGEMWLGKGASYFNNDGSGYLVNKELSWKDTFNGIEFGRLTNNAYITQFSKRGISIDPDFNHPECTSENFSRLSLGRKGIEYNAPNDKKIIIDVEKQTIYLHTNNYIFDMSDTGLLSIRNVNTRESIHISPSKIFKLTADGKQYEVGWNLVE